MPEFRPRVNWGWRYVLRIASGVFLSSSPRSFQLFNLRKSWLKVQSWKKDLFVWFFRAKKINFLTPIFVFRRGIEVRHGSGELEVGRLESRSPRIPASVRVVGGSSPDQLQLPQVSGRAQQSAGHQDLLPSHCPGSNAFTCHKIFFGIPIIFVRPHHRCVHPHQEGRSLSLRSFLL